MTVIPAASSREIASVLRSWHTTSRGPSASAFPPSSGPASMTLSRSMPRARAAASRNGCGRDTLVPSGPAVMVCAVSVKAVAGCMSTVPDSTTVHRVSR